MPEISVVIVTFNTKEVTLACLKSLFDNKAERKIEVLVVDNGSTDGTAQEIEKKFPKVKLLKLSENTGFAKGNNLGIEECYTKSKYTLLLNSDTLVYDNSIDKLINFSEKENFDIVSSKLLNPDGSFQPNAGNLPTFLPTFLWLSGLDGVLDKFMLVPSFHQNDKKYYTNGKSVGWVSGSVMLIKNSVFDKIGLFDKKIFMYAEDVDFCWRAASRGFRIGWTDEAKITHIGGASSTHPRFKQWRGEFLGLLYLYKKYYGEGMRYVLKIMIYFFVFLRSLVFLVLGKLDHAKTYAQIAFSI